MRVIPQYNPGDLLKFDMHFFKPTEIQHFHEINLERRSVRLAELDPRDEIFTVLCPMEERDIVMSGKATREKFITISPAKDNIDHRKLYTVIDSPIGWAIAWSFPAFMFIPANQNDLDLMARYVSHTHACPWCDQKIEAHIHEGNKLRFLCKSGAGARHIYNYQQFNGVNSGNYTAELTVDCVAVRFESLTQQYITTVSPKGRAVQTSITHNTPHTLVYENLVHIVNYWLSYC